MISFIRAFVFVTVWKGVIWRLGGSPVWCLKGVKLWSRFLSTYTVIYVLMFDMFICLHYAMVW